MKTTKYLLLIAFLFCITLNLRAQSGTCGANLTWELTDSTLTISGSGAMDNSHPWSSYSSQIARVSLSEGLTNICDDAFYACPNLQSIVIPNTVTSIGRQAFINCTSLKQVTLSNAVETIGHSAFSSTSITSITLPSSVTSVEDYAFGYCEKLTEITIPGSVSFIGNNAFQYCEQLSKATIEEGVKSIGSSTFYNCNKMTNIALPSSLISIGSNAFYNCLSLTSIVIPEQITTIEGNTFEHCSSLKEITLPSNLQTIGNYAFSNCGFTHIDIPNSVTDIKEYAFINCTNLTSVILPSNLKSVKTDVFKQCSILSSVTIPEGVTVIHGGAFYGCNLTELILPNSLERIGDYSGYSGAENGAFANNTNLTTVVIPKNVSKIGSFAFDGCKSLSQVTLQEGLTTIAKCAFSRCSRLQKITFPESLTTIEEAAFFQCDLKELFLPNSLQMIADGITYNSNPAGVFSHNTNLTKVVFQGKDTQIGSYAFYGCSALSQATLPKEITTISAATFMGCSSLSSIALPESLAVIEGGAFFGCGLESIVFPQSLQIIADAVDKLGGSINDYHGAFENNYKLTKITIPDKVISIGSWAFEQCTSLSEVILPEGFTTIGDNAFNYCSSLKTIQLPKTVSSISNAFAYSGLVEIEIPERVTALSDAFNGCSQLKNVILPPTITSIGDNTFKDCKSLPTITLPQSLTAIGASAFEGCYVLDNIVLPSQVKTIGSTAFRNCRVLREITIPNKVTNINSNVFQDCSSLTSVTLSNNVTTIGYQAFQNCYSLKDFTLPDSLTTIDSYAFEMCKSLHVITMPSKVNSFGIYVFDGCAGLSHINMLPPTPPTIDYRTFYEAPSNLKINLLCGTKDAYMANANWAKLSLNEISSNILTIKSNDNRMGEAYIPTPNTCDNDTAIIEALPREGYQFAAWHDGNTDNPRTITVTQDTTYIANFEPLTTYQLTVNYDPKQGHISGTGEYYPNEEATLTVTPLGGYRFSKWGDGNTDNPRTIVMTQDTTLEALFITGDYCGDDILYTFLNDTLALNGTGDMWNLSQYGWNMYADEVSALTLSNGITSLGTNAFMNLMFLPEVTIPASVKTIHKRAFENCRSLASVTFAPKSQLQTIDHWAFYECINLKALEIPEGVTTIGNGAFYGCAYLDSIVLPASMMSIADNGFAQCTKLSAMTVHAITPPAVDSKTFESVNRAIPVYVPFGTGATYRATPIWQEFDIREMEAEIGSSCDVPIEVEFDYTDRIEGASEVWYKLWTYDLPVKIHFTPDADNSSWGPEIQIDYTCSPGFYDDPKIEAMMNELSGFGMAMPIELIFDPIVNDGKTEWTTSINQSYREQLLQYGITYNVGMYIKITYFEAGEISFTQECENVDTEFDAKFCGSFTWNGVEYTEPGDYIQTYTKADGCDSIVTLHLIEDCPCEDIFTEFEVTACDFYEWNGQTYTQSGTYTYNTVAANGCDSIVTLHLTISQTLTAEETITACDFYEWNGQTYTQSGEYTYTTVAANGCDSIVTLHLTISPTLIAEETITACDSYAWNGQTYTQSGDYVYTTTAANGCDSIVTLHLTISPTITAEETITACDFYEWNGQTYTQSGEYTYTTVAANGCDSIVTLHLTISPTLTAEETITACDFYEWNGQTYTQSGEYTYTTVAANGCDSIVTLHLTISPTITAEETITACDFYEWNGQTYTQSGEYTYTTVAANGCDSIVTLHLTINQSEVGATEYATICYGETYTWNGQTYSTTGEYSITLSNALGCDSVATLYLTILPETIIVEESATINEEYLPYTWRGQQCYSTSTYTESVPFTNYPYCDSVTYMLNLTVEAPNKCGQTLYWHYSNNTLTITGSGDMYDDPDLLSYRTQEWYPTRVNNIILPNALTHIGNVAFADCSDLTNIVIPNSVNSIGDGAFSWTGLQSVTIPASVTELGEQVFEACDNLHTIIYEGYPTVISNQAIHPLIGCVHLDTVIAPAALWHCTNADKALENRYGVPHKARYIEVTDGDLTNQAVKYIAQNATALEVLDLTNATNTTLPYGAFSHSYLLTQLYLPAYIETLPESMIEGGNRLMEITIPATVTEIGNYAFAGCVNIWRMTVEATTPPKVYENTFDDISRSISVLVPAGSEQAYREAEYWREFFIDNTNSPLPISNCQKILREDQILILREGKVYTTMGQLITIDK